MIVVDSSALHAISFREPDHQTFNDVVTGGERCAMPAVNAHETATVLRLRLGPAAVERFWQFLADVGIEIVPFDEAQVRVAAIAFDRYGKGIDPRARLNLSDCAVYALAKTVNAPMLFKGGDFTHTDVQSCIRPTRTP
jgi:ribonuclease VapC